MRRTLLQAGLALVLCCFLAPALNLQARAATPAATEEGDIAARRQIRREQQRAANRERHETLRKETDRLLQLATELKLEVDRSSESTLSLTVIRKTEDIEKLARDIRRKMKGM